MCVREAASRGYTIPCNGVGAAASAAAEHGGAAGGPAADAAGSCGGGAAGVAEHDGARDPQRGGIAPHKAGGEDEPHAAGDGRGI